MNVWKRKKEIGKEKKKINGGPKTREIVVHALSKSIEEV